MSIWRSRRLNGGGDDGGRDEKPERDWLEEIKKRFEMYAETYRLSDVEFASMCISTAFMAEALLIDCYHSGGMMTVWETDLYPNNVTSFYHYDRYFHKVCSSTPMEDPGALLTKLNLCKKFLLFVLMSGETVHPCLLYLDMCSECLFETHHDIASLETRLEGKNCSHYTFIHHKCLKNRETLDLEKRLQELCEEGVVAQTGISLESDNLMEAFQSGRSNIVDVKLLRDNQNMTRVNHVEQYSCNATNINVLIECAKLRNKIQRTLAKADELVESLKMAREALNAHINPKYMHEIPIYTWFNTFVGLKRRYDHQRVLVHQTGGEGDIASLIPNPSIITRAYAYLNFESDMDNEFRSRVITQAGIMKNVSTTCLEVSVYNEYLNTIVPSVVKTGLRKAYVSRYIFFKYYESMQVSPVLLTKHREHLKSLDLKDILGSDINRGRDIIGHKTIGWVYFWIHANLEGFKIMHKLATLKRPDDEDDPDKLARLALTTKYFLMIDMNHIALVLRDVYIIEPVCNLYHLFVCWNAAAAAAV